MKCQTLFIEKNVYKKSVNKQGLSDKPRRNQNVKSRQGNGWTNVKIVYPTQTNTTQVAGMEYNKKIIKNAIR